MELDLRRGAARRPSMVGTVHRGAAARAVILASASARRRKPTRCPRSKCCWYRPAQPGSQPRRQLHGRSQPGRWRDDDRPRADVAARTDTRSSQRARRSDRRRHRRHPGERGPARSDAVSSRALDASRALSGDEACRRRAPSRRSSCGPCHRSAWVRWRPRTKWRSAAGHERRPPARRHAGIADRRISRWLEAPD